MLSLQRLSRWVFGSDGDILTDDATQSLVVASSVLVTGSVLLSPLISDLAAVFSISETRAGWLIVSFTATAAVCLPVVGAIADQFGRKPVMTVGLVLFGASGAAVGFAPNFRVALGFRLLQGVGFACASPVILTLIGDLYSGTRETTVQGIRVSVNSIMSTVVPLLAGVLFVYSWRAPFFIYALTIPVAVWVWRSIPEIRPENDWTFRRYVDETMVHIRQWSVALLLASFLLRFVLFYGLITYISVLVITEAAMTVVAVGVLMSVRGAVKTFTSTQAGRLSLSHDPTLLACVSFFFLALGIVVMGAFPFPAALVVGISITGVADGVLSPSQKSLVNQFSAAENRGGVMSTAITLQNIGKVIGPVVFGAGINLVGPALSFVVLGAAVGVAGVTSLAGVVVHGNPQEVP